MLIIKSKGVNLSFVKEGHVSWNYLGDFFQCAFTPLLSFCCGKETCELGVIGVILILSEYQNIGVLGVNQNLYQSSPSSMRLHPPCQGADVRTDGRNRHPLSTPSAESGHVLVHP